MFANSNVFLPQLFNCKWSFSGEKKADPQSCTQRQKVAFNFPPKEVSVVMLIRFSVQKRLKSWCGAHVSFDIKSILTFRFDGSGHQPYKGE